jgi:hypothetical protein
MMGLVQLQHLTGSQILPCIINIHANVLLVEDKGRVWGRVPRDISRLDIVLACTTCNRCVVCNGLLT